MGLGAAAAALGRGAGAACAIPRCILFLPLWWGSSMGSNSSSGTIMGSIRYATGSNCTREGTVARARAQRAPPGTALALIPTGWKMLKKPLQVGRL